MAREELRPDHHRQRARRLRRRHPRRPARPEGGGDREGPKFGGTCLHRGCIPTKALLLHGGGARRDPRGGDVRASTSPSPGRHPKAHERKRRWSTRTPRASSSCSRRTRSTGASRAPAASPARTRSRSKGRRRQAEAYARERHRWPPARCRARSLPAHRLRRQADPQLRSHPGARRGSRSRLAVLGAGAVGTEFASIFARFGCQGDADRDAPAHPADRGRGGLGGARRSACAAQDHVLTGTKCQKRRAHRERREAASSRPTGSARQHRGRAAAVAVGPRGR